MKPTWRLLQNGREGECWRVCLSKVGVFNTGRGSGGERVGPPVGKSSERKRRTNGRGVSGRIKVGDSLLKARRAHRIIISI